MKKLLLLIACMATIASCSENNQEESPAVEEFVKIGIKPTTVAIETSPLLASRNSSDDLYGLQIYEANITTYTTTDKKGQVQVVENIELGNAYACWVTDNLAKSTITLRKNKTYICWLVYVPNGKNILYKNGDCYGTPFFSLTGSSPCYDIIHYGSYHFIDFAHYGASQTKDKKDYRIQTNLWNQVDIYYGRLRIDATQDSDYQIDLYRMMFGLNIKATNFKKGKLAVFSNWGNDSYEATKANNGYVYTLTPGKSEIDLVLELTYMPWPFNDPSVINADLTKWSCTDKIGIDYIKDSGEVVTLIRQEFETQRMMKYTFELNVEELIDEVENNIQPNIIEEEWTNGGSIGK